MRQFHLGVIIGATSCLLAGLLPPQTASASGAQVDWIREYDSGYEPAFDFSYAIAVDPSGDVIVTGSSYGPDQLPDFVTIKYSSAGHTLWVALQRPGE